MLTALGVQAVRLLSLASQNCVRRDSCLQVDRRRVDIYSVLWWSALPIVSKPVPAWQDHTDLDSRSSKLW